MGRAKRRADVSPHGACKTTRCMARAKRRAGFAFLNPSKLIFSRDETRGISISSSGWLSGSSTGWLALAGWRWVAGPGLAGWLWLVGKLATSSGVRAGSRGLAGLAALAS